MPISRRALLGSALAGAGLLVAPPGFAQTATWPKRPVHIIVPFAAGVAADVLTRILADQLHTRLHQPFIVENRTGAGGNIAMSVAAKANPDGYTIVSGTVGTFSINQFLYPQMSFDPERDFALVSLIWEAPNGVFVSAEHNPAKTLSEFIAWAKEQPKGITFGSSGIGTTPHLAGELFRERAGISATHVPFRDAGQRLTQLLSGSIDFNIDNVASYASLLKAGQVRGLAVTSAERWPSLPDLPTMAEAGMPDFKVTSWGAFAVPAATPPPIVAMLSESVQAIAADPAVQERFMAIGAKLVASTPQDATAYTLRERQRWGEFVRKAGIKAE